MNRSEEPAMTKEAIDDIATHCQRSLPFECPSMVHGQTVLDLIADWRRYRGALEALASLTNLPQVAAEIAVEALRPGGNPF
jgi:hypothetical protein